MQHAKCKFSSVDICNMTSVIGIHGASAVREKGKGHVGVSQTQK